MKPKVRNQVQRRVQGKYRKLKRNSADKEKNSHIELILVGVVLFFIILLDAMDKI
jgi:hypothetical protein